ncbi:helix-turn-helix domain-containing protein [Amycolatopsis sp. 195334CR]|uniref:ArsR/SmtB family transcription factor n=1 Tax=Amycolatopsis sp. 195334CR TaxID=2814588 RepID=UPI001A8D30B8|nr:helix-turn-helix domain-containing protein [Amycolatopsis sp. 195334CR]MBN6034409.1 helix-turn-helix transcriptional regulator [Amycolatopsis sp. 195334CR]
MPEKTSLVELRVLAHPLRLRILSLLTGAAMSAAEAARELRETQANVSYHLRRLHEAGLLDVVEEVRIHGGLAKRYRHIPRDTPRWDHDDHEGEQLFASALAGELRRRTTHRLPTGRSAVTDAEVWLDPADWERAVQLANDLGDLLHSAALPPRADDARRVSATIALFEMERS